jgi:hypothetical protein
MIDTTLKIKVIKVPMSEGNPDEFLEMLNATCYGKASKYLIAEVNLSIL